MALIHLGALLCWTAKLELEEGARERQIAPSVGFPYGRSKWTSKAVAVVGRIDRVQHPERNRVCW